MVEKSPGYSSVGQFKPPAPISRFPSEQEAYQHGRTQQRLSVARDGLTEILERVAKRNDRASLRIAAIARLALEQSKPPEETR